MVSISLPLENTRLLLTPQWGGLPPWLQYGLLGLVCVLPILLIVLLYRYELKLIPRTTAVGLMSLRLLVALLILFLVCLQPVLIHPTTTGQPGRVLVAVDRSESMDVTDPQRAPLDKLRLARALHWASDVCPDELLDAWIAGFDEKQGGPNWTADDEARGRRDLYKAVCDRVDEKLTRTEAARRVLADDGVGLLSKLAAAGHDVEVVGFNRDLWDAAADKPDGVFAPREGTPAGQPGAFTDLRLPLERALERAGGGRKVLGVVVLTDGRHNAGDPPVKKANELGERHLPIYPIAMGGKQPPPDISVQSVKAPAAVYKEDAASVDVHFHVAGLGKQDVSVELSRGAGKDKKLVEKKVIHHDGADRDYDEHFSVKMDESGAQTLTVEVKAADPNFKEAVAANNSRSAVVNVAKDQVKALIIDGEARWEYHYLSSAMHRDKTMKVEDVVFDQPRLNPNLKPEDLDKMGSPREALPPGDDGLADYDCIVLGDASPAQLPPPERKRLEKYVGERGGTLVMVAGKRWMPLGFPDPGPGGEADPLRKLLPVEAPRVVSPPDGFPVSLTADGRDMKFMEMEDEPDKNDQRWATFPPHYWGVVGKAKPAAATLAFVADGAPAKGKDKDPAERERANALIAWQHYGLGRVLFVGLDSTWRWRFRAGDVYHHRFWGQVARWAADKPLDVGNETVRFAATQPAYRQGQEAEIVVRFKPNLDALKGDVQAQAQILRKGGDGQSVAVASAPLVRRAAQPNAFEAKVANLPEGEYEVLLAIPKLEKELKAPTGPPGSPDADKPLKATFAVTPPESGEMLDLSTDWALLKELAGKSGGEVYTPENAEELVKKLAAENIPHTDPNPEPLWQWPWLFIAVVLLLTLEWVSRKWAGLP
jgi:hypothetical protein